MARFFQDVNEGDELPPVVVEDLSRTDLVRYAGASGDFNPIHHDETFAHMAGQPSVFGHGMLTAAFVGRCVTDYVGPENLRRFKVRFATRVWPGDTTARHTRRTERLGVRRAGALGDAGGIERGERCHAPDLLSGP